jgi:hypothetical protein
MAQQIAQKRSFFGFALLVSPAPQRLLACARLKPQQMRCAIMKAPIGKNQ